MALKGVTVLELAGLAPAPFCGMVLADFGATVLRIDKIGFNTDIDCLANGKQSIALNLKNAKGQQILRELSKKSDVLIEPYRKGVMESLNLGPNMLMEANPRLIYARMTGYGQNGPYSKTAGHDINYIALSGLLSLFGRRNENPMFPANLAADFGGGGLTCALGIILALYERHTSGLGQIIDSNMVEGAAYMGSWLYRSQKMPIWGQERGRNLLDGGAHYYEVYKTKDGKYMSVGAIESQFYDVLLDTLQLSPEEVPQYGGDSERSKLIFSAKFAEKTQKEWCEIFDRKLDACVAPVLTLDEAVKHPHNIERGTFIKSEQDGCVMPKPAPRLSRTPGVSISTKSHPNRGQHTVSVLEGLNYDRKDIQKLEDDGVIECYRSAKL